MKEEKRYKILLFASLAQATGKKLLDLSVCKDRVTISDLLCAFWKSFPALEKNNYNIVASVNKKYASPTEEVFVGDEIAFFPPVSGG